MEGVKIDSIMEDQALDGDRVVTYVRARYRVADAGPFTVRVVKTDNWGADIRAAITREQQQIDALKA